MPTHYNRMQQELAELVGRHTGMDGYRTTAIPHLGLSRYSAPHFSSFASPPSGLYNPSIGIVVQGTKSVIVGDHRFTHGPLNYLITPMDLPIIFEALDVSPESPSLSCKIEFNPGLVLELLNNDELRALSKNTEERGMRVSKLDDSMLDAIVRLVRLLDRPIDIPVLAPLYTKEIVYRILHGENGNLLKNIVAGGGLSLSIKQTIEYMMEHFTDSFRIEELANIANMSVPSFHRHFKELTSMTPIQFQKQLRLQEARRLMLSESTDVADTAYRVGYESPTQFSREFSRMFGVPPREDIKRYKRDHER
ncbi:AraC family transcriptional regulator [Paenibacillus glycanilyticus]|uniref:Transcriptional regulator n=1 Tax=Paenibacillus glycanilyticus TaxID=126569 RepID=A0ABQ6GKR4_9BACL|nr:AraC family transcriptional regulator [Paenibacillus glycanilyticus]GLX69622.1 transcriptional regulator [Paenibacillus glycanilyticus]